MMPGILAALLGGPSGAPPASFAVTGTEREDGVLTITGGSPPYTVQRASDASLLASGVTSYTIPAALVGDEIEILDSASGYHLTAVIGSSALAWINSDDYTGANIPNRGTMGGTLDNGATAPASGSDTLGPYCDFTGANGLIFSSPALITKDPSDSYTAYLLADAYTGTAGFAAEFYQAGQRLAIRKNSTYWDVLDSAYRVYGDLVVDACELQCFTFNGSTSLADRHGYHGAQTDSGVTYNPRSFSGTCQPTFGAIVGGASPYQGKVRFYAIYKGIHDATKQAEVRAALKRTWAHVDQTALEIPGLRVLCNAESGNVTERVSGPDIFAEDATDLSGNGNTYAQTTPGFQPKIETDPGGRWNGKRVFVSDGVDDFLLKSGFDLGGAASEFTLGMAMEFVSYSSGARFFVYNGGSNYPRFYEIGSLGSIGIQTGASTSAPVLNQPVDTPTSVFGCGVSGVGSFGFSGGVLTDEDPDVSVLSYADGNACSFLAYHTGALPGDYRVGEVFLARTAFTPTLALVHGCRHHVEYGTALS